MRDSIIGIIKEDPTNALPPRRRNELIGFFGTAGDDVISATGKSMLALIEAEMHRSWTLKLKEFLEGNPPPPKYSTHRNGRTAYEFLEDVWGEFMDHDVLYQDVLSKYDPDLIPAIYGQSNYYSTKLPRMPLRKQDRTTAILKRAVLVAGCKTEELVRAVRAYARTAQDKYSL